VVVLHIVRNDLAVPTHRLSEYANGPNGWLMTTAFFAVGCGLIAMGVMFQGEREGRGSLASVCAFIGGAGMIVSGIFETSVSDSDELIHSRASAIAVVAVLTLALVHSNPFGRRVPDAAGTTLAVIALVLAAVSPALHNTRWTGLSQRALWFVLIAWLLRAVWNHRSFLLHPY
jgi:hypothetical protein